MAVNSVPSRSKFHPTVNYESGACATNSDTPPPRNLVSRIAADRDSRRDASSMSREYSLPSSLPPSVKNALEDTARFLRPDSLEQ